MKFVVVVFVIFFSWLLSFSLDCYWYGAVPANGRTASAIHQRNNQSPFPGNKSDNIFWFLQISDIHISIYHEHSRIDDLNLFIQQVVTTIKPIVVFVTGDITDAKEKNLIASKQFELEWNIYQKVLNQSYDILQTIPWIELRGNHDAFDVPWKYHQQDMYRRYAISNERHTSTAFKWTYTTKYGRYSFVGVDACPSPGLKRPYNFFGVLHEEDLSTIAGIMEETRVHNLTILLTHYPSSFISTDHYRMRSIFSGAVAHLCGHLHTLGDCVKNMYGRHRDGHLELELADWKYNRMYRLLAIDHDMLSFKDTSLHRWPLVLVTNPVNAQYIVPNREPIGRMRHSTHIRVLVFSPWPITSVMVSVDNHVYQDAQPDSQHSPLYVLPWQPQMYSHGMHTLKVKARDLADNEITVDETFSLDGTIHPMDLIPQYILLTDHRSTARMGFICLWLLVLACLLTAWLGSGCLCLRNLTLYPPVFYPFLLNLVYFGIGPWYVGELMTGVYGLVFAHGVLVAGHFLPGSMTYLHGVFELFFFHIPVMLYLGYLLRYKSRRYFCLSLPWLVTLTMVILYFIWGLKRIVYAYGWLTLVVSPGYSWCFPLFCILVCIALRKQKRM